MSKKQKRNAKQQGGSLDVDTKAGRIQAKNAVGIAAIVNTSCTGNQKIRAEIESVTADENGVLIGVVARRCTEDES